MTARITYNSKNIDLSNDAYRLQIDYPRAVLTNRSASGLFETLNVKAECRVSVGFRNFLNSNATDATLKRNLQQWLMWAQAGLAWTFAWDSAEVVSTTLAGSEAAGQTAIGLTSTTGIDVGGLYVIRSLTHIEVVKIASVDSAVQVTLTETLNHDYSVGGRFRSERYWPARLASTKFPIIESPPLWYGLEFDFFEDVNDL